MATNRIPVAADAKVLQAIIKAEKLHLAHQFDALRQLRPQENFQAFHIADSVTLQSSAKYDRKLNHTCGFGVSGSVTESDLEAIEQVYQVTGVPPELDMCEYAHPSAFDLLKAGGYAETGTVSTFSRSLSGLNAEVEGATDGIEVTTTTARDASIATSVEGFRSGGRQEWLLSLLAQSAAHRADTTTFFARIDGEIAGAAGLACLDVCEGVKFANFYIDSTLPAHRGKGVHKALILARMAAAKKMGCEVVMGSARAGSGSARNMERAGMRLAFHSTTYTKQTLSS